MTFRYIVANDVRCVSDLCEQELKSISVAEYMAFPFDIDSFRHFCYRHSTVTAQQGASGLSS